VNLDDLLHDETDRIEWKQSYPVPPVVRVDGLAWVLPGPLTRRATEADLARLEERQPEGRLPFDQRAVQGATLADLDIVRLQAEYEAERGRDEASDTYPRFEAWLALHGVARRVDEGWRPTNAGLLLHGLSP
jgi:ATP-dependent DNA helicase RecG